MPSFEAILKDIHSLIGLQLRSIKPGADIVLTGIESAERRFLLRATKGGKKSRPFSEVETIVKALNADGIVHVDTVLAGSGSSRNQPETILANLPYIDYTFIDKKKHLVLRSEPSHPIGNLKELDLLEAKRIVDRFKARQTALPIQLIVTSKLREMTSTLVALGGVLKALSPTVYSVMIQNRIIWVVTSGTLNCSSEGTYVLLPVAPTKAAFSIGVLFGNRFFEEPSTNIISVIADQPSDI
jgi:hypothetical protein